jgi:hypothetical protein
MSTRIPAFILGAVWFICNKDVYFIAAGCLVGIDVVLGALVTFEKITLIGPGGYELKRIAAPYYSELFRCVDERAEIFGYGFRRWGLGVKAYKTENDFTRDNDDRSSLERAVFSFKESINKILRK